jgi:outer membrane protein OmpA-like peptidoglycan-associated protein
MKKYILTMAVLALVCGTASAQGFLGRLGERARQAVENNVGNKIEKGVNDLLDGKKKDKDSKKNRAEEAEYDEDAPVEVEEADATAQNAKNDFVRGSVILFEDTMDGEQLGEFPSKWDIIDEGSLEVAMVNSKKYAQFTTDYNYVTPLMSNPKSYLPEVFTLEWDMFVSKSETEESKFGEEKFELQFRYPTVDYRNSSIEFWWRSWDDGCDLNYQVRKPNFSGDADYIGGESRDLVGAKIVKKNAWNHFAVSFNKRALKVYVNGVRIFNIPNMEAPGWFVFWQGGDYKYRGFTNVVLAKGGVDLYAQNTTDLSAAAAAVEKAIAETGKFVTNNILFETGKATLKPESMEEIQKVAEYMKKNPTARFEVQGHTDNQGSDKINDPLSQQRAEAVVKALEEQGVDPFNLRPVGKGSHEPVADNKTEEGRAKNRRVEFIKK